MDMDDKARAARGFRSLAHTLTTAATTARHRDNLLSHADALTRIADTLDDGATPPPSVVRLWGLMLHSALALLNEEAL